MKTLEDLFNNQLLNLMGCRVRVRYLNGGQYGFLRDPVLGYKSAFDLALNRIMNDTSIVQASMFSVKYDILVVELDDNDDDVTFEEIIEYLNS